MLHLFWRQKMKDIEGTNTCPLRLWQLVNTETVTAEGSGAQHRLLPLQSRSSELSQGQGTGHRTSRLPLIPVSLWPSILIIWIFWHIPIITLLVVQCLKENLQILLAPFHHLKYYAEQVLLEISFEMPSRQKVAKLIFLALRVVQSMLHCAFSVVILFLLDLSCSTGSGYDSNHPAVQKEQRDRSCLLEMGLSSAWSTLGKTW